MFSSGTGWSCLDGPRLLMGGGPHVDGTGKLPTVVCAKPCGLNCRYGLSCLSRKCPPWKGHQH